MVFCNQFTFANVKLEHHRVSINWRAQEWVIHLDTISNITGILIAQEYQNFLPLEEYIIIKVLLLRLLRMMEFIVHLFMAISKRWCCLLDYNIR